MRRNLSYSDTLNSISLIFTFMSEASRQGNPHPMLVRFFEEQSVGILIAHHRFNKLPVASDLPAHLNEAAALLNQLETYIRQAITYSYVNEAQTLSDNLTQLMRGAALPQGIAELFDIMNDDSNITSIIGLIYTSPQQCGALDLMDELQVLRAEITAAANELLNGLIKNNLMGRAIELRNRGKNIVIPIIPQDLNVELALALDSRLEQLAAHDVAQFNNQRVWHGPQANNDADNEEPARRFDKF